jgi:hypothetical protein
MSNKQTYLKLRFPAVLLKKLCTYGIKDFSITDQNISIMLLFLCMYFAQ